MYRERWWYSNLDRHSSNLGQKVVGFEPGRSNRSQIGQEEEVSAFCGREIASSVGLASFEFKKSKPWLVRLEAEIKAVE